MQEKSKTVSCSRIKQIQLVMPQHANNANRLFGGQLMAWVDVVGGIVAFRHSESHCITAAIDYLSFDKPIYPKDIIVLDGCITHVGNSSMEIRVDTFVEKPGGILEQANRAYLIYVALDEQGVPRRVPRLVLETDEERAEWEEGTNRAKSREARHRKAN